MWSLAALHWIGFRLDSGLVLLTRSHPSHSPTGCCQCCLLFHFFFSNNFSTFSVFRFVVSGHLPYNSLFMCTGGMVDQSRAGQDRTGPGPARKQASSARRLRASLCAAKVFCAQQRLGGDQTESAKQTGGSTIVPGFALSSVSPFHPLPTTGSLAREC